ncbi:uncharacterized protein LOC123546510 [Mercenaria mercenaria]|uniref:uncharacterized protein LOC123546510 n=1 Tax=Mercenaria mercenaria TaxID=6596 RepID=UPI00234E6054|nr:uncharacterized protein LOC123546510 [Mercenaria mercenaria]
MADIVSTKFGDRRLVYLPPINLKGSKTPKVETIEAGRQVPDRYGNAGDVSIVPKEYAYNDRYAGRKNAWLGGPVRSTIEGNIVTEQPRAVGDQIFEQLYQQATTNTMANYGQGQYPVLPPIGDSPKHMHYTNVGLQPMAQQQAGQNPQLGPSNVHQQGSGPNEKHIYYGPNGEVLEGPPSCCQRPGLELPRDFVFEGLLYFGRLRTINLIESVSGFPKLPDYLIKDLLEKYGQYEHTTVRVVARLGRCYVHATPHIRESPRVQPEYVPVYLNEDEEFDYGKFISDYQNGQYVPRRRRYGSPPKAREIVYRRDFRPSTYDDVEHLRWRREDERFKPTGRETAPSRAESWVYRTSSRRTLQTRDDIKPIEKLDRRLLK